MPADERSGLYDSQDLPPLEPAREPDEDDAGGLLAR
jgi:hypothetical protein